MRKLLKLRKYIFIALLAIPLFACSTFYYGFSKEEWAQMSERDRALAKVAYYEVLAEQEKNKKGDPREEAYEDFKDRAIRPPGSGGPSLPNPI